jgi:dihydrofolate reductase
LSTFGLQAIPQSGSSLVTPLLFFFALGALVAALGFLVALVGFVLSNGPATWFRRWSMHRRLRRLPYDARLTLLHAATSRGGRIPLPQGSPEAAQLVNAGYLEIALERSGATIFRVPSRLMADLRPEVFLGLRPRDHEKRNQRIYALISRAAEHLADKLPPARVCVGPVAATKAADAWRAARLPWSLEPSYEILERETRGRPVIMDRRTWDCLPERPLPGRLNIVVTRSERAFDWVMMEDGEAAETLDGAFLIAREHIAGDEIDTIHVVGGPALVRSALKDCELIHLTEIQDREAMLDRPFAPPVWREISREVVPAAGGHPGIVHRILSRSRDGQGREPA